MRRSKVLRALVAILGVLASIVTIVAGLAGLGFIHLPLPAAPPATATPPTAAQMLRLAKTAHWQTIGATLSGQERVQGQELNSSGTPCQITGTITYVSATQRSDFHGTCGAQMYEAISDGSTGTNYYNIPTYDGNQWEVCPGRTGGVSATSIVTMYDALTTPVFLGRETLNGTVTYHLRASAQASDGTSAGTDEVWVRADNYYLAQLIVHHTDGTSLEMKVSDWDVSRQIILPDDANTLGCAQ